jgi:hypothetical protein
MAITIQRGRQFAAGDAATSVFDGQGKAGTYLQKAADKLVAQKLTVVLRSKRADVKLTTADDWKKFLAANASTKDRAAKFADKFGITFQDFLNAVDDVAASDDTGVTVDLRPSSDLAKALSLDKMDDDYAAKMAGPISLTGANGAAATAQPAPLPTIGPEILAGGIQNDWNRDRAEQESWADFKLGNGASSKFRDNTGVASYAKLYEPKWDDPEALALIERFAAPLHAEIDSGPARPGDPPGTRFQDHIEMFRETYYDDRSGALSKSGASVRARVRFDNTPPNEVRRVLIQGKEGREVDAQGNSIVHKFEKRFEGNDTDEKAAQGLLVNGKDTDGKPLKVAQVLYALARDRGTLPADGNLRLEAKYTVLQKRRRTHLQLDSVGEVQTRRTALQGEMDKLAQAGKPVPDGMKRLAAKMDAQLKLLTDCGDLLKKYDQYMPSGECFIVSADRYSVYDPAARKEPPTDPDDEVGRIGRGPLHVEAEWDTAASEPFAKALDEIDKRLAAHPANQAELEADRAALEGMRASFRKDVQTTVELMKERLLGVGLEEEPSKMSKDQRAAALAAAPDRPVFWL